MKLVKNALYSTLLTATMATSSFADCGFELFNISSMPDTKIIDFVNQLSDDCRFSVIIKDKQAQEILETKLNKIYIKDLTIYEVLDIILAEHNLSYTLDNNILKISYLNTRVFNIDYILSQRKSTGGTNITLSSNSNSSATTNGSTSGATSESGTNIISTDEVKFWDDLDKEFKKILNRPSDPYVVDDVIINKNAGLVTVTATAKQMERLERYLEKLQKKVQLQVLIDVQLLSVTTSDSKSTGIDWAQLYKLQNISLGAGVASYTNVGTKIPAGGVITDNATSPNNYSKVFTLSASGSLSEVLKFLKTQGDVKSISNPKVLTLNNQPALITAGTEYFYKIQQSTNQQGTSGGVAATTQNDVVQSIFAGVLLSITPEIADDKTITLKINPSISETRTALTDATNTGRDMPPDLDRRQLSSVVTVKDGNKIILGGLINTKSSNSVSKVPLLGDIPLLGNLFKRTEKIKTTQEIVIIIKPHIIHKEKNTISLSDLGYQGFGDIKLKDDETKYKQHTLRDDTLHVYETPRIVVDSNITKLKVKPIERNTTNNQSNFDNVSENIETIENMDDNITEEEYSNLYADQIKEEK